MVRTAIAPQMMPRRRSRARKAAPVAPAGGKAMAPSMQSSSTPVAEMHWLAGTLRSLRSSRSAYETRRGRPALPRAGAFFNDRRAHPARLHDPCAS